ncbi:indole-3-acetaldehyde oxidase-like [Cucumis melo var. makuwa]|uniref:Indole-3-acetaldehyde oxidase-like n=1 Tax=Cucumis melo var. makuwa TaxID=1194695 RepID=A0A5D3DE03_CUCMM|nr:indole-3-acetaldehyde oxidase-like [Cucumis melo var. makuwa]
MFGFVWPTNTLTRFSWVSGTIEKTDYSKMLFLETLVVVQDIGEPQEYILPSIWDRLATSSSLKQRAELVRVVRADTASLIQGGCTAGSTTSESSCEAVRLWCNVLVERLTPLNRRLEEKMGSVKWDVLISQCGRIIQVLLMHVHGF